MAVTDFRRQFAPRPPRQRSIPRGVYAIAVALLVWFVAWRMFNGVWTLPLQSAEVTPLHLWLNEVNAWVRDNRDSNVLFVLVFDSIRIGVGAVAALFAQLFVQTDVGLQLPEIGWLGVVALVTWVAAAVGNYRVAILTAVGFTAFGVLGVFTEAMWTFALTLTAVLFSVAIGLPLGIWAGVNKRVNGILTPILDFMQTLPSFVYLAPLALLFLIGPASAVIATIIYAVPPIIRLTAHGIRSVPATIAEAADSLGVSKRQRLMTVLLPLARNSMVVGLNQTVMAALAMVTIAALIAGPGLGQLVVQALQSLNVGRAFVAGFAIVVMAIVLDRVTTAASRRAELSARHSTPLRRRRRIIALGAGLLVVAAAVYLSRSVLAAARFPAEAAVGEALGARINDVSAGFQNTFSVFTASLKDGFTIRVINPFQGLLTATPFLVVMLVILVIAVTVGGIRAAVISTICLLLIIAVGLWEDAMITLASTLIATVITMALALAVGVIMGRSDRVDRWLRPGLDAAQTMPAFVYLVPFLGLFGPSRFTAIVAAIIYAAPVAIKIIAEGIAHVSAEAVEAAQSTGASPWQTISKVQIPLAASSITLAANQGLIYVLSMVVVGGLVGGGALGYAVVAGFSQNALFGKGLAAGVAIVLLGIMLDRITQAAVARRRRIVPVTRRVRDVTAPLPVTH
ncbi:MAG: ABC transporter permease subunit [Microbacteriaceae bacterium]|nr:ABC transporter permease subunit [Microbacteriaceae bacterium]